MALWHCTACTAAYAVGLPRCPQCGSTEREEEVEVPKINRAGVSYEPGREPDGPREQQPGLGVETEAAEHPADGTVSPTAVSSEPADSGHVEPAADAGAAAAEPAPEPKPAPKRAPSLAKPKDSADGGG